MAFLSGSNLVEKTDGEMVRWTGCLSAEDLVHKMGDRMGIMKDCSLAVNLAEKMDDLMMRVSGCLSAASLAV